MIKLSKDNKSKLSTRFSAAFIMAAAATGPGFMTQISSFTEIHGANLIFAIILAIIFNIGIQLNVSRVVGVSGMRGQVIANNVINGSGYVLMFCIVLGGLIFNIGNIGGAALGLQVLTNINTNIATIICGIIGILIFITKGAKSFVDIIIRYLGIIMIIIAGYTAFTNNPPIQETMVRIIYPKDIKTLIFPMLTILGGSVGGFTTFVGGHKLIDAGVTGEENINEIDKSILSGIGITSVVRILFFLAILGVVSKGVKLDSVNPAASAFQQGVGELGYKFFGVIFLCAGISATVAATYTSASFLQTLKIMNNKNKLYFSVFFIIISALIMNLVGQPTSLLIVAGTINGLILPIVLVIILLATRKREIVGNYKHPLYLLFFGILSVIILTYSGFHSLSNILLLFK